MDNRKINIVYITDENYSMPTMVSIVSLLENRKKEREYLVYIIGDTLRRETKQHFMDLKTDGVEIVLLNVEGEEYQKLADTCLSKGIHVSRSALYKFQLPALIPEKKVLYLDGDVIVNKDISSLFDNKLGDAYVAAAEETGNGIWDNCYLAERIGILDGRYFNSGVMLLNLEKMRNDEISKKLLDFRIKEKNYFMDQDALNYVLGRKRKELERKYNFMSTIFNYYTLDEINKKLCFAEYKSLSECLEAQTVIHLTDKMKPWQYNIPWFSDLFNKYYEKSVYSGNSLNLKSSFHIFSERCINYVRKLDMDRQKKIWKFPYEKVKRGSKVVIYGAGEVGADFKEQIERSGYCDLKLWTDRDYKEKSDNVDSPEKITQTEYDYVIIAASESAVISEIREQLLNMSINEDKIIQI